MILLKQCYVWYKVANVTYFHYLVWTLRTSRVSFVLLEYKWCCVTKFVHNSSGILSLQVKAWGSFWITPITPIPFTSNFQPQCSFVALFLWLNGWLHHVWCYYVLCYVICYDDFIIIFEILYFVKFGIKYLICTETVFLPKGNAGFDLIACDLC